MVFIDLLHTLKWHCLQPPGHTKVSAMLLPSEHPFTQLSSIDSTCIYLTSLAKSKSLMRTIPEQHSPCEMEFKENGLIRLVPQGTGKSQMLVLALLTLRTKTIFNDKN